MSDKLQDITGQNRTVDEIIADLSKVRQTGEQFGGGSGGGNGMIERIARLEASLSHVQRDMDEARGDMKNVRDRLVGLEIKVDHLPSKGFIVTATLIGLAVIGGFVAFQDQMQSLLGATGN